MKKVLLLTVAMVYAVLTFAAPAADIIVTTGAQKINAKILEVTPTEIKYKESSNPNGPIFTISVDEISSIIYANGKVAAFNKEPKQAQETKADYDVAILTKEGEIVRGTVIRMNDNEVTYESNGIRNTLLANQLDQVVTTYGISKFYRNKPANNNQLNNTEENAEETTRSAAWAPRYGGYIEFGGFVGKVNQQTMGGVVMDVVNGCRFNDYAFAGIGFGLYNTLYKGYRESTAYRLGIPIYLDLRVVYPTKKGVNPYFGVAIGPKVDFLTIDQNDVLKANVVAFYKMNFGFEVKHFTMGVGYQMEGKSGQGGYYTHYFDLRFGARLGK